MTMFVYISHETGSAYTFEDEELRQHALLAGNADHAQPDDVVAFSIEPDGGVDFDRAFSESPDDQALRAKLLKVESALAAAEAVYGTLREA